MELRWTPDGLPVFGEALRSGLLDFHAVYEAEQAAIVRDLMPMLERIPALAEILKKTSKAQLDEQSAQGALFLRKAIVDNDWKPLIENQRTQGGIYAALNVPFRDWFDLIGGFQTTLLPIMQKKFANEPERLGKALIAMARYIDVSMSVVAEAYLASKQKRIDQQAQAITELSTPVLQLRERLLLLPIIGVVDTHRARLLTEDLLRAIRAHRARVVVMDVTGVAAVDSRVANHLLQCVEAARLMGARVVVTGLSPEVATTLVTLGVDLSRLDTMADLQTGLEDAEHRLGLQTVKLERRRVVPANDAFDDEEDGEV